MGAKASRAYIGDIYQPFYIAATVGGAMSIVIADWPTSCLLARACCDTSLASVVGEASREQVPFAPEGSALSGDFHAA